MSWKTTCVVVLGASGFFFASEARAADDPPATGGATGTATATATAGGAPAAPAKKEESGETDHDTVVGHVGVGFFGIRQLPIGSGAPGALPANPQTVDAPVIGARYWIQRNFGIDVGFGFATAGGSRENVAGATTTTTDKQSATGFAFHLGVPIAFAHGKHYTFLLIPETTLGFTSGTLKGTAPAPDTNYSGFLWNLGARIGAEIHFGFIGIPQLALEGGVGLYFQRTSYKVKQDPNSTSDGTSSFTTSLQGNPWAIFLNQVSAIYYF